MVCSLTLILPMYRKLWNSTARFLAWGGRNAAACCQTFLLLSGQTVLVPIFLVLYLTCMFLASCHLLCSYLPIASPSRLLPSISFFLYMSKFHNVVPSNNVLYYKYLSLLYLNIMRCLPNLYGSPHRAFSSRKSNAFNSVTE